MSAPVGAYVGWAPLGGLFGTLQAVAVVTDRWPTLADLVVALAAAA